MKWLRRAAMALCMTASVTGAQGADGKESTGKLIGSGDGYEIRLVPSGPVALVNAPQAIQSLLAPVDAPAKASSSLAPPASATGGVFLVSDARSLTRVPASPSFTDASKQDSPGSNSVVYLNRQAAVSFQMPGSVMFGSRGVVFPGTVIYTNLATGEKTSFLVDANEVLSAAADEHYLYVIKAITIEESHGNAILPTTHTVLTAQPLSKNGDVQSVTVDPRISSKSIPLPRNFSLSLRDGVIVVGSIGHYTFDGKEFKVVQ